MAKKWKLFLITILMLPMVVFFPACSCGEAPDTTKNKNPSYYTVTFYTDSKDTFNIPSQTLQEGQLVRKPPNPYKTGYRFVGWFSDKSLESDYYWTFEIDTIRSNLTLYAKWEKRNY